MQLGPNTTRHLLFECKADVEVWKLLGIDEIIKKALLVDKAGEVNLEHLLCVPEQDVQVLGLPKLKKTVAMAAGYLWYECRKLTHGEKKYKTMLKLIWQ